MGCDDLHKQAHPSTDRQHLNLNFRQDMDLNFSQMLQEKNKPLWHSETSDVIAKGETNVLVGRKATSDREFYTHSTPILPLLHGQVNTTYVVQNRLPRLSRSHSTASSQMSEEESKAVEESHVNSLSTVLRDSPSEHAVHDQSEHKHEHTTSKSREKYERELIKAIARCEETAMSEVEWAAEALRRLSLHSSIEKRLRKEEAKLSQSRAKLRAELERSNAQVTRSLIQAVRSLRHQCEQMEEKERARENLEQTLSNEIYYLADQITLSCGEQTSALPDFDAIVVGSTLRGPLRALKSALAQFLALHSDQHNPQREIKALKQLLDARKIELEIAGKQIDSLDNQVRELKDQVALSRLQRTNALEEATAKAYVRANDQYSAEIKRLKTDKDALTLEVKQLRNWLAKRDRSNGNNGSQPDQE